MPVAGVGAARAVGIAMLSTPCGSLCGVVENVVRGPGGGPYACPCCGYLTLRERGADDICQVCFWEDDGQDDHDADIVRGGPNRNLSLTAARDNFVRIGASEARVLSHVRPPRQEERPPS
jgi:hypothetical protein